uniref:MJ0570-related uncharacterized domain-containing protein n=1 Tax=Candidatus Kentrum sp. UNK TaxID=2126344 RepID=A0A451AM29_9GAMM|nr:MAG: MJ0570-related uncharacterized domain-containing protein [Candidatus Kentron sp. UNK]VFK72635.1 MAG: MJ0570-related uncharacterized domain-containing protein [Candidatus Kentron sp. UNK]
MEKHQPAFSSWSGGKDSCLALYYAEKAGYNVDILFNMLTEDGRHSRSHGLYRYMLEIQARAMNKRIVFGKASWESYEKVFSRQLSSLKDKGIQTGVFGDIDLQEHRDWVERVCGAKSLDALLPLWGKGREELFDDFLAAGFRAIIVCVKESALTPDWLGRELTARAKDDFRKAGIDLCGEEGEYHSFVFDGPLFESPVAYSTAKIQSKAGHSFIEIQPKGVHRVK